eukprot:gene34026-biopygen4541
MKKLCKLSLHATDNPVKQLGYFDVTSSVNYGGTKSGLGDRGGFGDGYGCGGNACGQALVPSSGIAGATVDVETVAVTKALVADRRRQGKKEDYNERAHVSECGAATVEDEERVVHSDNMATRTQKDKEGWSEYEVTRRCTEYVLLEVKIMEPALPMFTVPRVDAKVMLHLRLGRVRDGYIEAMDFHKLDLGEVTVKWLSVGETELEGWTRSLKALDAQQWKESDYKEECALIDVKKAIVPVETVPASAKVMRMVSLYKVKLDSAKILDKYLTRLQKSVYVLKQAPREPGMLSVFVDDYTVSYVHVDDYTVFTTSLEWKVEFFRAFGEKWLCSLVRLNCNMIMYSSKLHKIVAVSTTEGELITLSECARDVEYVVNLLSEFYLVTSPMTIHGDNHA